MDTQPDTLQLVEDRGQRRAGRGLRGRRAAWHATVLVCVEILHAIEQGFTRTTSPMAWGARHFEISHELLVLERPAN